MKEGSKAPKGTDKETSTRHQFTWYVIFLTSTFQDGEDVKGNIAINFKGSSKLEHQGIKIELIGVIENQFDKTQSTKFLSLMRDLEPPGVLTDSA